MCGISGVINPKLIKLGVLKSSSDIIRHRGPDDEGFVAFNNFSADPVCLGGKDTPVEVFNSRYNYKPTETIESCTNDLVVIAFGHRRLSILDLSPAGHQPMSYLDGRYWIVFNGEIYNFIEIQKELKELGHIFVSQSDTEVVLASYAEWGVECQHKFNGMWAFVIYDREKHEIFMSRDRYGIKPLYYWFSPDESFCFASEIKQFTVLPGWKAVLNKQRAYDYLFYSLTDHTNETMFKGVYHIPPGQYYSSNIGLIKPDNSGQIQTLMWHHPKYTGFKESFIEATTKFESLFKDAVKMHLRADVPVGSALSGGLDSSAIVCEINNLLKKSGKTELQKTFSSCSVDERYDEKKWMDIVVNETEVDAHFVYPKGEDVFKLTNKILWHQDEPYQSQSAFLGYHVFQSAKEKGVLVLLNGQGADEYLSGYSEYNTLRKAEMLKTMNWKKLWNEMYSTSHLDTFKKIIQLNYSYFPKISRKYFARKTKSYKNLLKLINTPLIGDNFRHPYDLIAYDQSNVFNISHRQILYTPLQKYLRWEDRNSMAHSVEARVPFLDYRLVEFTTQLPLDFLDEKNESKKIMIHSLKNILPEKILNRKDKKGFITPEERWLKVDFSFEFRKALQQSIIDSKGIISDNALVYLDEMIQGKIRFDYTYWRLILFGKWMKLFNVTTET